MLKSLLLLLWGVGNNNVMLRKMNRYKRRPGAVYTYLFGSMPFLFRSWRRHSTGAASWLIPIRRAVTFLQRAGGRGGGGMFPLQFGWKEDFSMSVSDVPLCRQTYRQRNNESATKTRLCWRRLFLVSLKEDDEDGKQPVHRKLTSVSRTRAVHDFNMSVSHVFIQALHQRSVTMATKKVSFKSNGSCFTSM